jgi:glycosyltransferase involved in cell wall biosynthesis
MPHKKHVVTVIDPKKFYDWFLELRHPSRNIFLSFLAWIYENNFLVIRTLNRVDALFYCAHYLEEKVRSVYSIEREIAFLPNPVVIPEKRIEKSSVPTVCFVGRWDRRKRPELFFKLAKKYPQVEFVAPGKSQDKKWDIVLRHTYGNLSNLNMPGFIDQFTSDDLSRILAKSWILINTSTREGLPTSFLEALAHKCAILSSVNPEKVTSSFGFRVQNDNFAQGLESLLADNTWRKKGQAGYQYVAKHYALEHSINQHCALYERLLI